jgi:uncharacterized protein YdhG (YjbR/CyaY superfamily)
VHGPGQLVDRVAVVPDAQQRFSYGLPGFKIDRKTIAGFAAFKNHLSYLPHIGSVFPELADELAGYQSAVSLRFPVDGEPSLKGLEARISRSGLRGEHALSFCLATI